MYFLTFLALAHSLSRVFFQMCMFVPFFNSNDIVYIVSIFSNENLKAVLLIHVKRKYRLYARKSYLWSFTFMQFCTGYKQLAS